MHAECGYATVWGGQFPCAVLVGDQFVSNAGDRFEADVAVGGHLL
jgi:hypothetical protein